MKPHTEQPMDGITKEGFESLVLERYGIIPDRPFANDQSTLIFRHPDNEKWFAAVIHVHASRLALDTDSYVYVVNLKCKQDMICHLWQENGIYPAYHMSKAHWISVLLDGSVDKDTVGYLLKISFELTKTKKNKK